MIQWVAIIILMAMIAGGTGLADPFVDGVVEFVPGAGAGFGQDEFPGIVLGPPIGAGISGGSLDVLSLGDGGVIVLEFIDNIAVNGPGPDLIIFENAFYAGGNPENIFCEVAFVEVSQDGIVYHRFPNDFDPDGTPVNNPANWSGFAGVGPVFSHPDNGIDPTDPETAGGDAFDLDDLGLDWIRFVRIIDADEGENAAVDDDGDVIYDPGMPGGTIAGFDLDALCAVHSEAVETPTPGPEATATPDPTASPSPTPENTPGFEFDLNLSQDHFISGNEFLLAADFINPSQPLHGFSLYVILDIYGSYFFHPSWTAEPDCEEIDLLPGASTHTILKFIWPAVPGHAEGIAIWGGILTPENLILGSIDHVIFSY